MDKPGVIILLKSEVYVSFWPNWKCRAWEQAWERVFARLALLSIVKCFQRVWPRRGYGWSQDMQRRRAKGRLRLHLWSFLFLTVWRWYTLPMGCTTTALVVWILVVSRNWEVDYRKRLLSVCEQGEVGWVEEAGESGDWKELLFRVLWNWLKSSFLPEELWAIERAEDRLPIIRRLLCLRDGESGQFEGDRNGRLEWREPQLLLCFFAADEWVYTLLIMTATIAYQSWSHFRGRFSLLLLRECICFFTDSHIAYSCYSKEFARIGIDEWSEWQCKLVIPYGQLLHTCGEYAEINTRVIWWYDCDSLFVPISLPTLSHPNKPFHRTNPLPTQFHSFFPSNSIGL